MKNSKLLLGVAVAGLLVGAQAALAQDAAKPATEEGKNGCKGANSCKGKNSCKGTKEEKKKAGNACSGPNGCDGKNSCKGTEAAKPATTTP